MKKQFRRIAVLSLLLLFVLVLAACGRANKENSLESYVSSVAADYTYTGTTANPPATSDPALDTTPLSAAELNAFLALVNFAKVSQVQQFYYDYYIGEFRSVEACTQEILDTIAILRGIRTVTDTEGATGVFIDVYARVLGDKYAYYYPPTDYSDYTDDINGEYTGIGVSVLVNEAGYAEILNVFPGSPAEEVGLLPGDVIVAIEGEDFATIGYSNAIDRIRGAVGTSVTITVSREGAAINYTIQRRRVTEITVEGRMMDGNIGYIRIVSFNENTYEQFVATHRTLEEAGATSYVFDLRNNPGGTLTSVVAMLEYILPSGPIVHLNYKNDVSDCTVSSIFDLTSRYMDGVNRVYYENHQIAKPMVVLANGNTASAGELFTSSLADYGVATVIGTTTYGKGVGQSTLVFGSDRSAMVLTTFSYDPPTSANYDGIGITPHVSVTLSEEAARKNLYKLTYAEDLQLQAAVAVLTPAGVQ